MKLTCKSCKYDFSIDEKNLDTEKVDCPKCFWPNLIYKGKVNYGHFGHFTKRSSFNSAFKRKSRWLQG